MKLKDKKKNWFGAGRVDLNKLLLLLAYIDTRENVAIPELCRVSELSRATVSRYLASARRFYQVEVTWYPDNALPSNGEYRVDNWGILDKKQALSRLG